jgi:hypothetical protein
VNALGAKDLIKFLVSRSFKELKVELARVLAS